MYSGGGYFGNAVISTVYQADKGERTMYLKLSFHGREGSRIDDCSNHPVLSFISGPVKALNQSVA